MHCLAEQFLADGHEIVAVRANKRNRLHTFRWVKHVREGVTIENCRNCRSYAQDFNRFQQEHYSRREPIPTTASTLIPRNCAALPLTREISNRPLLPTSATIEPG